MMLGSKTCKAGLSLLAVAALCAAAGAAEIQFRGECRVHAPLVRLGDVAEITGADEVELQALSAIDLVPAPPAKERRVLRAREIQDLLQLRGVRSGAHRFSGSSQVTIVAGSEVVVRPTAGQPSVHLTVPMQQIAANVRQVIQDYLCQQTGSECTWTIKFDLQPQQAQTLSAAGASLSVEGGQSPFTGLQNLTITFMTHAGQQRVLLAVQVTAPPFVVVAASPLVRGAIIKQSDVRLQPGKPSEGSVYVFRSIEEVVGKEATRAIVEGQILDEGILRRPLLVQRSDVVTVYAKSAGLRVRTTARALEAGGEGDLVRVESMADRKSFLARISGPQEVEVFAQAPVATSDGPSRRGSAEVQRAAFQKRLPAAPIPPDSQQQSEH